jgi:hypothetical protein
MFFSLTFFALGVSGKEKIDPNAVTLAVDCGAGESLIDALAEPSNNLTIEFTGTCTEDLNVQRGNVTIAGQDSSATLQGSVSVGSLELTENLAPPGPVHLVNFDIVAGTLEVSTSRVVLAYAVSVSQSPSNGINVLFNGVLVCVDCTLNGNSLSGMQVESGGTAELAGTTQTSNNGNFGLNIFSGADVVVGDRDGRSVNPTSLSANGNQNQGLAISNGGSFTLGVGTTLTANQNLHGMVIGTGGAAFLFGTTNVAENTRGVNVISGELLAFGPINAVNNSEAGLRSESDGKLRAAGGGQITGSETGARAIGGTIELYNVAFSGNGTNVELSFGSKAILTNGTPPPVCDGTSIAVEPVSTDSFIQLCPDPI